MSIPDMVKITVYKQRAHQAGANVCTTPWMDASPLLGYTSIKFA